MPTRRAQSQKGAATGATTIEDVLHDAVITDFDNATEVAEFEKKHSARLCKKTTTKGEVLHQLAKETKDLPLYRDFIKWAIKAHRQLLCCKDIDLGLTPLHVAIREDNDEFVSLVLEHADDIGGLLCDETVLSMTCLHLAIEYESPFTELIIEKALEATAAARVQSNVDGASSINLLPGTSSQIGGIFTVPSRDLKGYEGMTALHMAVIEYQDSNETADRPPPQGPPPGAGPKLTNPNVPVHGVGAAQMSIKSSTLKVRHDERPGGTPTDTPQIPPNTKVVRRPTAIDSPIEAAPAPSNEAPVLHGAREFDALEIVKKLIAANDRVLVDKRDAQGNTPFQRRLSDLRRKQASKGKSKTQLEAERSEMIQNDRILSYMRDYIIDNFYRKDAMTALYKIGEERVLEFDLSGLPHSSINAEFLSGLRKVLRFEGLLKYVALPRLVVEDDKGIEAIDSVSTGVQGTTQDPASKGNSNKGKGLQHMYPIFQWLKKRNVSSIRKLTVIDDVEPSHSDEAIEACLEHIDVRVWNWYKVDLCSDVILNAAPNVTDVTLYSSGSNAVLVGWSSTAGLARLNKLERVHINVKEGLERSERLKGYLETFENKLLDHKPNVKVTWKPHKPDANYNSVFTEQASGKAVESPWMQAMERFAEFIKMTAQDQKIQPIKVALIDDGIDTTLDDFTDKIQVGDSFYRGGEYSGRLGSYYVPTGPHGTIMAQSICKMCPAVKLYIAQLEVLPGQNGQRSFTAESATEAILWAVKQGVDIISMSWSINSGGVLPGLNDALLAAERQKIIMFCASIDEGGTAVDKTYPGRNRNVIKIGASTGKGAKLSWVSESNSDFLLPGEAPPWAGGHPEDSSIAQWSRHLNLGTFGSSVSTALAAGLAAVLLYCDRLVSPPPAPGEVDELRHMSKMVDAFKVLSRGTEYNKFPQVQDYLPHDGNQPLVWSEDSYPEETKEARNKLQEFMKMVKK